MELETRARQGGPEEPAERIRPYVSRHHRGPGKPPGIATWIRLQVLDS
jgi:hypothetical protein